ncbi:hypothetical protein [Gordonia paraffinivorans]|uniref:hypothetical protein n=1 Tax=Gordonia paraffinivorans TaxID=175628 RepID=UPI00242FC94E|nr:hypothetical protein [Gordonia paraffinivorans]
MTISPLPSFVVLVVAAVDHLAPEGVDLVLSTGLRVGRSSPSPQAAVCDLLTALEVSHRPDTLDIDHARKVIRRDGLDGCALTNFLLIELLPGDVVIA